MAGQQTSPSASDLVNTGLIPALDINAEELANKKQFKEQLPQIDTGELMMKYLNKLSSDAMQSVIIPAIDGKNATCIFLPSQKRWMIDIVYGDFVLKGYYISCTKLLAKV